ncbi:MAG: FHA domain-containing protein [Chloroflexi bacterium]|nr:FHA domain-containing protein [Chloroflexota bacterium]
MTALETVVSQPRAAGVLRIKEGSQAGATFPLSEKPVIIGREQGVAILLDDEESSRRHAQISWEVGQFIITDMGSTNGTFVNGTKIAAPHMLRPDDEIMVGKTTLVFQVTETPVTFAVEAPATEAPATEPAETEEFVAEAPLRGPWEA